MFLGVLIVCEEGGALALAPYPPPVTGAVWDDPTGTCPAIDKLPLGIATFGGVTPFDIGSLGDVIPFTGDTSGVNPSDNDLVGVPSYEGGLFEPSSPENCLRVLVTPPPSDDSVGVCLLILLVLLLAL